MIPNQNARLIALKAELARRQAQQPPNINAAPVQSPEASIYPKENTRLAALKAELARRQAQEQQNELQQSSQPEKEGIAMRALMALPRMGVAGGQGMYRAMANIYNVIPGVPKISNQPVQVEELKTPGAERFIGEMIGGSLPYIFGSMAAGGTPLIGAAASRFPMAANILGSAAYGAVQSPEGRVTGGLIGGAIPGAFHAGSKLGSSIIKSAVQSMRPETELTGALAKAIPASVKAPIGELVGSEPLKSAQYALRYLPFSGMKQAYGRVRDYTSGLAEKIKKDIKGLSGEASPESKFFESQKKGYEKNYNEYQKIRKEYVKAAEKTNAPLIPENVNKIKNDIKEQIFKNWDSSTLAETAKTQTQWLDIPKAVQQFIGQLKSEGGGNPSAKTLQTIRDIEAKYIPRITADDLIRGSHKDKWARKLIKEYWEGAPKEETALKELINLTDRYNLTQYKNAEPARKALNEKWRELDKADLGGAKQAVSGLKNALDSDMLRSAEGEPILHNQLQRMNKYYAQEVIPFKEYGGRTSPFLARESSKEKPTAGLINEYIKPDAAGDDITGIAHVQKLLSNPEDIQYAAAHFLKPAFDRFGRVDLKELNKIYNSFGDKQKQALFGNKKEMLDAISTIYEEYPKAFDGKIKTKIIKPGIGLKSGLGIKSGLGVGGLGFVSPTIPIGAALLAGGGKAATTALTSNRLRDLMLSGGKDIKPSKKAMTATLAAILASKNQDKNINENE